MDLSEEQETKLAEIFAKVLEERRGIDAQDHADQHRFVKLLMEERRQKEQRREVIRQQVTGWAVIGTLSSFFLAVGYAANHWFEEIIQRVIN